MLTPNQIKAAELLSQGSSHQEVADACNVSRRTILRWLNQNDFKNLSYAMINRQRPAQQTPQRLETANVKHHPSSNLKPSDLVADALTTVRGILRDSDARPSDRLKACSLVGEWAGLAHRGKTVESQALQVLIEANWVSDEVLETLVDGWAEVESKIKNVLANGHKKTPPQESEGETFDDEEFDD